MPNIRFDEAKFLEIGNLGNAAFATNDTFKINMPPSSLDFVAGDAVDFSAGNHAAVANIDLNAGNHAAIGSNLIFGEHPLTIGDGIHLGAINAIKIITFPGMQIRPSASIQFIQLCNYIAQNNNMHHLNYLDSHHGPYELSYFLSQPDIVASANFNNCPSMFPIPAIPKLTIYQSALISCVVNGIEILAQRQLDAQPEMNSLYKILENFDKTSREELTSLIRFISKPTAQKALKWLHSHDPRVNSKNPEKAGELFISALKQIANENLFLLNGVCKEWEALPLETSANIFSYLTMDDISLEGDGEQSLAGDHEGDLSDYSSG